MGPSGIAIQANDRTVPKTLARISTGTRSRITV